MPAGDDFLLRHQGNPLINTQRGQVEVDVFGYLGQVFVAHDHTAPGIVGGAGLFRIVGSMQPDAGTVSFFTAVKGVGVIGDKGLLPVILDLRKLGFVDDAGEEVNAFRSLAVSLELFLTLVFPRGHPKLGQGLGGVVGIDEKGVGRFVDNEEMYFRSEAVIQHAGGDLVAEGVEDEGSKDQRGKQYESPHRFSAPAGGPWRI